MKKAVPFLPVALIIIAIALIEYAQGRLLICKCGYVKLWEGVVNSSDNSQHIADWYSLSHIIHGFIFFGVTWLLFRKWLPAYKLLAATLIEGGWELLENSSFIINRYREGTISLDYYGDSVINSTSDIAFMIVGFFIASKLTWKITLAAAIAMELLALYVIRDNLTLNIIMLVYPIEAIKHWQAGV